MRGPIATDPSRVIAASIKSPRRRIAGMACVCVVLGAILIAVECWLADVLGDDLIAIILLLIGTIILIALSSPILSKSGRR